VVSSHGRAVGGCAGSAFAVLCALAAGCSVGSGQGAITLDVAAPACDLDEPAFELAPSFFSAEVTGDQLNLRIQRGSDIEGFAYGIVVQVLDVNEIFDNRIGIPIEIRPESASLVRAVLYLNETCPSGFPDYRTVQPVVMEAQRGQIVFDAIYAPDIDPGATRIEGQVSGVRFESAGDREETHADADGWFSFFYQRGAPAQRFP